MKGGSSVLVVCRHRKQRLYSAYLTAVFSGFLVHTYLEPFFTPVGTDTAMAFLDILTFNGALVGMALGVLLPTFFAGLCLGASVVMLICAFVTFPETLVFPVSAGVLGLTFAAINVRYVQQSSPPSELCCMATNSKPRFPISNLRFMFAILLQRQITGGYHTSNLCTGRSCCRFDCIAPSVAISKVCCWRAHDRGRLSQRDKIHAIGLHWARFATGLGLGSRISSYCRSNSLPNGKLPVFESY